MIRTWLGVSVVAWLATTSTALADTPGLSTIYLNRCTGGCTINGTVATDDATTHQSTIPCAGTVMQQAGGFSCSGNSAGTYMMGEYVNLQGQTGAAADAEWKAVMQCVKEVYSPYNVNVTDVKPTAGVQYTEGILAGLPSDLGLGSSSSGGVAPARMTGDCTPHPNVMVYGFANATFYLNADRVNTLCYVISQETAHSFGLDHEYSFVDGTSSCRSPMTYRQDCGGQHFFRDLAANCGETANRACHCGGLQNSHQHLIMALGAGTPITRAPTAKILSPAANATVQAAATVQLTAGAQRGVARVDLYLNGHNWASAKAAAWTLEGQPDPSPYSITFPSTVPDGVIDIVAKAYDDIGIEGDSATITVTKGAACATASTCLAGQKCEAGKCFWDPPVGVLGAACTYNEYCTSGICQDSDVGQYCSQACVVGSTDGCPATFDCVATSETGGVCLPQSSGGGGCCSVEDGRRHAPWAPISLGVVGLGLVLRRRRVRSKTQA